MKKHPSEFFRPDTPPAGADMEKGSPVTPAKSEAAENKASTSPSRGFIANLFGKFSHTALIEEVEIGELKSE